MCLREMGGGYVNFNPLVCSLNDDNDLSWVSKPGAKNSRSPTWVVQRSRDWGHPSMLLSCNSREPSWKWSIQDLNLYPYGILKPQTYLLATVLAPHVVILNKEPVQGIKTTVYHIKKVKNPQLRRSIHISVN